MAVPFRYSTLDSTTCGVPGCTYIPGYTVAACVVSGLATPGPTVPAGRERTNESARAVAGPVDVGTFPDLATAASWARSRPLTYLSWTLWVTLCGAARVAGGVRAGAAPAGTAASVRVSTNGIA